MATIDTDDLISVSEASKLGLSRLLNDAEHGHDDEQRGDAGVTRDPNDVVSHSER